MDCRTSQKVNPIGSVMPITTHVECVAPKAPIAIKYQGLVERLKREFPESLYRIIIKTSSHGSYGSGFAIYVIKGDKRTAYVTEDAISIDPNGDVDKMIQEIRVKLGHA